MLINCPNCNSGLEAPDNAVGCKVQCAECGHKFIIAQPQKTIQIKKAAMPQKRPPIRRVNRPMPPTTSADATVATAKGIPLLTGRLRRRSYWLWSTVLVGVFITIALFVCGIDCFTAETYSKDELLLSPDGLPWTLLNCTSAVISTILAVRRLHDVGVSGWWYLPWFIIYLPKPSDSHLVGLYYGANVLLVFIYFIVLGCFKGTKGPNKYGPDPRQS